MAWEATLVLLVLLASGEGQGRRTERTGPEMGELGDMGMRGP